MAAPRLYVPQRPIANTPEQISRYLFEELGRISTAFDTLRYNMTMDEVHVAPSKPFEGMYIKADGTNWDPGNGAGPYMYVNSAWLPMFDTSGTAPNTFGTVAVSGQSNVVADASSDTLNLAAGSGITITTNAGTDTVTITAAVSSLPDDTSIFLLAGA